MKKKSFFILCLLASVMLPLCAAAGYYIPIYDVNKDHCINIADVSALIDCLLRHSQTEDLSGDADHNGYLSINDVVVLIDYLMNPEDDKYFDPKYAPEYAEIVIPDGAEVYTVNGVSFVMIPVDTVDEEGNLVRKFSLGQTEVTEELWKAVMGTYKNKSTYPDWFPVDRWPVGRCSWYDAHEFIDSLNALTGLQFRLPTEAEWYFAAIGGLQTHGYLHSGSDNIKEVCWYANDIPSWWQYFACPIATKAPNELGFYDMNGNVWEWADPDIHPWPHNIHLHPDEAWVSGGSMNDEGWLCEVNSIVYVQKDAAVYKYGFRLAL